jgi:MscS family membrane protein
MFWTGWTDMFLGNTYAQFFWLFVYSILGIIVGKSVYFLSSKFIRLFTKKTKTNLDDILIELLEKPVIFLIILSGFYLGINQLTIIDKTQLIINKLFGVSFAVSICWIVINFVDAIIVNYIKPLSDKSKSDLNIHLLPLLRKMAKIIFWVMVFIMIIKSFGFDVSALVTGVGIGGLAFALAAQDLLSNLFGGIAILSDKPFRIGDRIKIGANEGFIREIGMRTTRMETLDGTQLVIPNSDIAKSVLENVSREKARKIRLNIGLTYNTPKKKIIEAQKIIYDVVKNHQLTENESVASLSEFGESALNILIIYWIKESNVDKLLEIKNEINLSIKDRFEKSGVEMAFPTRTIHIINDKNKKR